MKLFITVNARGTGEEKIRQDQNKRAAKKFRFKEKAKKTCLDRVRYKYIN